MPFYLLRVGNDRINLRIKLSPKAAFVAQDYRRQSKDLSDAGQGGYVVLKLIHANGANTGIKTRQVVNHDKCAVIGLKLLQVPGPFFIERYQARFGTLCPRMAVYSDDTHHH